MRPPGRTTRPDLVEERPEVGEVAKREATRDTIHAAGRNGECECIALHQRGVRPSVGEHSKRQVHADHVEPALLQIPAEVAGPRR